MAHPGKFSSLGGLTKWINNFNEIAPGIGFFNFHVQGYGSRNFGYIHPELAAGLAEVAVPNLTVDLGPKRTVTLQGANSDDRTVTIDAALRALRATGKFDDWAQFRGEMVPIHGPDGETIGLVDRFAGCVFGAMNYGSHMFVYSRLAEGDRADDGADGGYRIWVSKRSDLKPTYPGKLDSSVAGCISCEDGSKTDGSTLYSARETILKEGEEEACLRRERVEPDMTLFSTCMLARVFCETVNLDQKDAAASVVWCLLYLYQLQIGIDERLVVGEGEAHDYRVMRPSEIKEALLNDQFKYDSAISMIEFLRKHGLVTDQEYEGVAEAVYLPSPLPMGVEATRTYRLPVSEYPFGIGAE